MADDTTIANILLRVQTAGLNGFNEVSAGLTDVDAQIKAQSAGIAGASDAEAAHMRAAANSARSFADGLRTATIGVGLLGAGVGAFSLVEAARLEGSLQKIQGNTGMTRDEMASMRAEVLKLGAEGPQSLETIATGFEHAANLGYRGADATNLVTAAWKAAIATGGQTGDMVNVLATQMRNFQEPTSRAAEVTGELLTAAQSANIHLPDLTANFSKVGVIASSMHQPLSQAVSLYASLTRATGDAALSQTLLVGMMTHVLNPTKQATDLMGRLAKSTGVDLVSAFKQTSDGTMTLAQLMELARQATHGNATEIMTLFGGIRGGVGALQTLNSGWMGYHEILDRVTHSQSQLNTVFDAMMKTFGAQFGTLVNNIKEIGIDLGDTLLPGLTQLTTDLRPIVSSMKDWTDQNPQLAKTILEVATAAGVLSLGLDRFEKLFGGLTVLLPIGDRVGKVYDRIKISSIEAGTGTESLGVKTAAAAAGGMTEATVQAHLLAAGYDEMSASALAASGRTGLLAGQLGAEGAAANAAAAETDVATAAMGSGGLFGAVGLLLQPEIGIPALGAALGVIAYEKSPAFRSEIDKAADALRTKLVGAEYAAGEMAGWLGVQINSVNADLDHMGSSIDKHFGGGKADPILEFFSTLAKATLEGLPQTATFMSLINGGEAAGTFLDHWATKEKEAAKATAEHTAEIKHQADVYRAKFPHGLNGGDEPQQSPSPRPNQPHHAKTASDTTSADVRQMLDSMNAAVQPYITDPANGPLGKMATTQIAQAHRMAEGVIAEAKRMRAELDRAVAPAGLAFPILPPQPSDTYRPDPLSHANASQGAKATGAGPEMSALTQAIGGLPSNLQSVMAGVTGKFGQELEGAENTYINGENAENNRHADALKSIYDKNIADTRQAEADALSKRTQADADYHAQVAAANQQYQQQIDQKRQAYTQSESSREQTFAQKMDGIRQREASDRTQHESNLKALHSAYQQSLSQIHGAHAAQLKQTLTEDYTKRVAAEDKAYQARVAANDRAAAQVRDALDHGNATQKTNFETWLKDHKKTLDDNVKGITKAYEKHVNGIQDALNNSISGPNGLDAKYRAASQKEDANHQTYLVKLKQALDSHVAEIEKAMKAASTPQAIWDALGKGLQTHLDNASKALDAAMLSGADGVTTLRDRVVSAQQALQQYTDAQNREALAVDLASGKMSEALQSLTTEISQTIDRIAGLIYTGTADNLVPPTPDQRRQNTMLSVNGGTPAGAETQMQSAMAELAQQYVQLTQVTIANRQAQQAALPLEVQMYAQAGMVTQALQTMAEWLNSLNTSASASLNASDVARATQTQLTAIEQQHIYATADSATKLRMLSQAAQGAVSALQQTLSGQGQIDSAQNAVAQAGTQAVVDAINDTTAAIQDESAIVQAESGVARAAADGQVAGVRDQAAIIRAQGDIANAKTSTQLAVARDELAIAQDQLQVDETAAHGTVVLAQDQVKIAADKLAADRAKAASDNQIDAIKISIAQDVLAYTKDQVDLQNLLAQQGAGQLSALDALAGIDDQGQQFRGQLTEIMTRATADFSMQQTDNAALQTAVGDAATQQAQLQQRLAEDSQQLARDQAAADSSSAAQQLRLAQDGNRLAADQVAEQALTNSLMRMSLSDMQSYFGILTGAVRNLKSGVTFHWVGSGTDPFESFINSAPAAFASNPTMR